MEALATYEPDASTDVADAQKSRQKGIARPHLRPDEIALALNLRSQGKSFNAIATILKRHHTSVQNALEPFGDTRLLAKAKLHASTLKLVERVVEQADVDQAIDVLSRPDIGVLAPADKGTGNQGVQVLIGSLPPGIGSVEAKPSIATFAPVERPAIEAKSESESAANTE